MNPRRVARIARWEVSRSAGTIDRATAVGLLAIVLVTAVGGATVLDTGAAGLEAGVYTVGVADGSPYGAVAEDDTRFVALETTYTAFADGETDADVFAAGSGVLLSDGTRKGDAAYAAFRDAIVSYNDEAMDEEADDAAAYPVVYAVEYHQRDLASVDPDDPRTTGSTAGGTDASSGDGGFGDGATGVGTGGGSGDGAGGTGGPLEVPDVGGGTLGDETTVGTPGSLSPPFPFESLVLAFLFVVPMNVVIQAYGSSIIEERLNRRGELLLVSPASRYEIVAGKTLPYLLALVGIVVGIAWVLEDGGALSVAAALPIASLFLAATFVGAMLARSFKELTFVTVAISVFLTTYTFVPAIFTDVNPIALISPLSLVVFDLQDEAVTAGEYLFSTGPFYLAAGVSFLLGVGLYREEDMFAQKSIPAKALDAIAGRIHGYRSVPLLSILFIPFVFLGQLLLVALLFAVPSAYALPALFVTLAAVEEVAKSVHVYAGFARSRFEPRLGVAAGLGALSGLGFFVGEKLTHVVQFVGLPDLTVGLAAFGPALSDDPIVLVAVIFAPLVLHSVTAVISAIGASRGRTQYALAFTLATLVHAVYNLGVVELVS